MVIIFGKIRSAFGEKMLSKRVKTLERQKMVHNFNTARTIGIIFDAGQKEDLKQVKEFAKYLSELKINCTVLGYVDSDEIHSDLLFYKNISIFSKKELDFFFRPTHPDAVKFQSAKFDILIDLSLRDYFPIRWILGLSTAPFKVGRYSEAKPDPDFMIDIHSQPEIEFLIEQIKNYVSILNNPQASNLN